MKRPVIIQNYAHATITLRWAEIASEYSDDADYLTINSGSVVCFAAAVVFVSCEPGS
jgi:hypothetical protein